MPAIYNEKTGQLMVPDNQGQWVKAITVQNPETGEKLYLDGNDWKPMPLSKSETYDAKTLSIAQGATANLAGDEFLAGVGAISDAVSSDQGQGWMLPNFTEKVSKGYDKHLRYLRDIDKRYMAQNPAGYLARNIVAGAPVAALTGGPVASGVRSLAPSLGRVGQAAGVGSVYGAVAGFGGGEGGLANRLESAGQGAAFGAVTGAALEGLVSPLVSRFVSLVRGQPRLYDPTTMTLTVEGQQLAQRAGLNPNEVSSELAKEFATQARNAVDPADAARVAEATTLPVRVPVTRGQATLDPAQQMFESQAYEGVFSPNAQRLMREFRDTQQEALLGNVQRIQNMIGGQSVDEVGQGVQAARQSLINRDQALRARTNQLYQAARNANGQAFVLGSNVAEGLATMRQRLSDNGFTDATAGRVLRLIEGSANDLLDVTRASGQNPDISVGNLFSLRAQLNALGRSSDQVEASAAGQAKRALDELLDNAVTQDFINGDPAVVELWRRAIASRREMAQQFPKGSFAQKLVERSRDGSNNLALDANAAMNLIFNTGGTGWASKAGMVDGLRQIRRLLQNNPQAWNSLREEAFMRIAREAQSTDQRNIVQFSGAKFATAWEKLQRQSPEVWRAMFTEEERNLISQFARVAKRVTTTVPGGRNFSATSAGFASIVKRLFATTFMGPRMASFLEGTPVLKGAQNVGNEMRVTATLRGGFPTAAPTPPRVPIPPELTAAAASAGTQFNQQ